MNAIVAVSADWGIGRDNDMLFFNSEDMAFFKDTTMGKTVVMGRKTLESLPGGRPLRGRENIVLSRQAGFQVPGTTVFSEITELLQHLKTKDTDDVFVIGGAEIYARLLPYCRKTYVTHYIDSAPPADAFFPDLGALPNWRCASIGGTREHEGLRFAFAVWENTEAKEN